MDKEKTKNTNALALCLLTASCFFFFAGSITLFFEPSYWEYVHNVEHLTVWGMISEVFSLMLLITNVMTLAYLAIRFIKGAFND